jgi:hypothetical protein
MANYKIAFKSSVAKDLRNIPNADVKRILSTVSIHFVKTQGPMAALSCQRKSVTG